MPVKTLLIYLHHRLARAMPGYVTAGSRLCIRTSRDDSTSCRLLFPTPEKPLVPPQAYACGCGAVLRAISGTEAELTPHTHTLRHSPPHHGGSPSRGLHFPSTPPPRSLAEVSRGLVRGEAARPALGAAGEARLGLPAAPAAILAPPQGAGRGGEGRGRVRACVFRAAVGKEAAR